MVGNFIADGVKGDPFKKVESEIAKGVKMHRAIDHFMDNHPITEIGKKRLRPAYGKYSAVIIDIYYDYFLAKNWKEYSNKGLKDFSRECYEVLGRYHSVFPERSKRFYYYMVSHDILTQYSKIEGIDRVLNGMAGRTKFESGMENAIHELQLYMKEFDAEFREFFPDMIIHIEREFPNG